MITITDEAAEKAKELLTAEGKSGWGIRVFISGSGCCGPAYGMDIAEKPETGDEVHEKNGLKLFADKDTAVKLQGCVVDYLKDGDNEGFVIKDPNPPTCSSGCC